MVEKKEEKHPTVAIAGTVCVFATGIAALILIFANKYAWTIIFTTLVLCLFGIIMAKGHCCCGDNCECNTKEKKKK